MKTGTKVFLGLLVTGLGVTGVVLYNRYQKTIAKPDVKFVSADWPNGTAVVSVNGVNYNIKSTTTLNVNARYSIEMTEAGITLKDDRGAVMELIASKPQ